MNIQMNVLEEAPSSSFPFLLLILMVVLVIMSAFFSMSETAFSAVSEPKLRLAIEGKVAGAKNAIILYEKFDRTVTTLLIGNNLVNVGLSTIAVLFFTKIALSDNPDIISLVSTLVITLVLLIFGEIVPKMFAKQHAEAVCTKVSIIVLFFTYLFFPFVMLFVGIQKLMNKDNKAEVMEKGELNVIIEELKNEGEIEANEASVLLNTLSLNNRSVVDIMVPRIKMEAININSTLEEVKSFMMENPYSRIPVYKTDKDHIIGILYERDFFPAIIKNSKVSWKKLLRTPKFVSGAMKTDDLIAELQKSKTHIAIVSGEYGEVLGLVTMEDALEELVGEIYDEHDIFGDKDIRFEEQEDGSYIVDAEIFVEDLFEKLGLGDVPDDVPSKVSGWVFENAESLPKVGFSFNYLASYTAFDNEKEEYEDFNKMVTISIHEVKDRAVTLVKVTLRDATEEEIEAKNEEEE